MKRTVWLVLAFVGGCGPMPLTTKLHQEPLAQPGLVEGRYVCDVEAVRGTLDAPPTERALAMDVTFRDAEEQALPPHLQAYGRTAADAVSLTVTLSPADARRRWPEDFVADARPQVLDVRFQDARYFTEGGPGAEVSFAGEVPVHAVIAPDAGAAIAAGAAWIDTAIPAGLAPVLRAVRRHPWVGILALRAHAANPEAEGDRAGIDLDPARVRVEPAAWLAGERALDHEDVLLLLQPWREVALHRRPPEGIAVEDCALLLRLIDGAGRVSYARVPLVVLREGDDLDLACREDRVAWARREVWRGRMSAAPGETSAWPVAAVQLARTRVPYGFDDLREPNRGPHLILRAIATPFAWTLDILGWTNPVFRGLLDWITGPPEEAPPRRSR